RTINKLAAGTRSCCSVSCQRLRRAANEEAVYFVRIVRRPLVEDQIRHAVLVEAANLVRRRRQVRSTVHDDWRLCDRAPALVGKTGAEAKRKAAVGVDPGNDRAWRDLRERDALDFEADADVWVCRSHEDQWGTIRSVQFRAGIARIGRAAAKVLE